MSSIHHRARKVDWKVAIVMEQFLRMLHACGLPKTDATWQEKLMPKADRRLIQLLFTSFN
jgi:hypothetical protein